MLFVLPVGQLEDRLGKKFNKITSIKTNLFKSKELFYLKTLAWGKTHHLCHKRELPKIGQSPETVNHILEAQ